MIVKIATPAKYFPERIPVSRWQIMEESSGGVPLVKTRLRIGSINIADLLRYVDGA